MGRFLGIGVVALVLCSLFFVSTQADEQPRSNNLDHVLIQFLLGKLMSIQHQLMDKITEMQNKPFDMTCLIDLHILIRKEEIIHDVINSVYFRLVTSQFSMSPLNMLYFLGQ